MFTWIRYQCAYSHREGFYNGVRKANNQNYLKREEYLKAKNIVNEYENEHFDTYDNKSEELKEGQIKSNIKQKNNTI